MSFVPRCAGFSLTVTLTGRQLTLNLRIKVKWEQRMLIFYVLLHCILFYLILIFLLFVSFIKPLRFSLFPPLPVLHISPFCEDAEASCPFPDAQNTLEGPPHPHPTNNSALMEIFNIACRSPLGAVDGV